MAAKMERSTVQYSRVELLHMAAEYFPEISKINLGKISTSLRGYCEDHEHSANYYHFRQSIVKHAPKVPRDKVRSLFNKLFPFTEITHTSSHTRPHKKVNSKSITGLDLSRRCDTRAPFTRER